MQKIPHQFIAEAAKAPMFAVDSSTIKLTMNSCDWARHRREKAAAKLLLGSYQMTILFGRE